LVNTPVCVFWKSFKLLPLSVRLMLPVGQGTAEVEHSWLPLFVPVPTTSTLVMYADPYTTEVAVVVPATRLRVVALGS